MISESLYNFISSINPLTSLCAGAPTLKYGDVNTVTPSFGEVKGLINIWIILDHTPTIFIYNNLLFILSYYMASININPLTWPGEGVTVFTSPYLSVGTPKQGEANGLNTNSNIT